MKVTSFLILLLFVSKAFSNEPEIEKVKILFHAAASSKPAADQLVKLLSNINNSSTPLLISYKGAAEMMQAKYALNPISKLKRFNSGKQLIEAAVKKAPEHIEIRFLRFAIQTNLPAFLNYNGDIQQDKKYLLANLKTVKEKALKENIIKYLSTSKYCSAEEKKGLLI